MTDITITPIATPIHGDISGIYVIRNNVSGRVYVGSSARIKGRWRDHRSNLLKGKHHSRSLQRSWIKHGEKAFSFIIIEEVANKAQLFEREQVWMDGFNSFDALKGFNVYPTAGGARGHKWSPELRAKMKGRRTGEKRAPRSDEYRRAQSLSHMGIKLSPQTCAKMSASHTGIKCPHVTAALKGKPKSPAHAAKIIAANRRRKYEVVGQMSLF